jgi:hypothetical protein
VRSYPDGFVFEVQFRFDAAQRPVFPGKEGYTPQPGDKFTDRYLPANIHRPTFLGNSGVGIYRWAKNADSKYLYEVQVTDNAAMTDGKTFFEHENRFIRADFGADLSLRGKLMHIDPAILAADQLMNNPSLSETDGGSGLPEILVNGGADSLCAVVAGNPVSYFYDVTEPPGVVPAPGTDTFPQPGVAVSSPKPLGPNNENPLPISGEENPLDMCYKHRADFVPRVGPLTDDKFFHRNHLQSDQWNDLYVCFLPARYLKKKKCANAYLTTRVNGIIVFDGEIKSGTRTSRRRQGEDPEPDVYLNKNGDFLLRLLGHWGTKVYYRLPIIRSVGSEM